MNVRGTIEYANDAAELLLGYAFGELSGRSVTAIMPGLPVPPPRALRTLTDAVPGARGHRMIAAVDTFFCSSVFHRSALIKWNPSESLRSLCPPGPRSDRERP